jgi:hypothetical protein
MEFSLHKVLFVFLAVIFAALGLVSRAVTAGQNTPAASQNKRKNPHRLG